MMKRREFIKRCVLLAGWLALPRRAEAGEAVKGGWHPRRVLPPDEGKISRQGKWAG